MNFDVDQDVAAARAAAEARRREEQAQRGKLPPARYSGVLAHPTSLPGPHGIGDLGSGVERFLDWLAAGRQQLWQILPLGPTGYGDSPYQSFSSFAGNPLLVSLDRLADEQLLTADDLANHGFPQERVVFGSVIEFKIERLRRAAARFAAHASPELTDEYTHFRAEHAGWLEDYALFMALKEEHGNAPWYQWPEPLALRAPDVLEAMRGPLRERIDAEIFMQFAFFQQWRRVRELATARGIRIVGDIPIFVAMDSADVWANRELFQLDVYGRPTAVAGVPPDYFSATGQLWGNPLYDWQRLAETGYAWWIERLRAVYELVDIVRIDHFRGFEAYWVVPAGDDTARNGRWAPGPGRAMFDAARAALGDRPVIAEDLGLITPAVDALREGLGYPGMAVLQFAFGAGPDNLYLPHNLERNTVVYTGTHDNDTTTGWYAAADEETRHHVRRYLSVSGHDIAWDLIRAAWSSTAETAITPLQDLLGLDTDARMNRPGEPAGNWGWRVHPGALHGGLAQRLADVSELYGRVARSDESSPTLSS